MVIQNFHVADRFEQEKYQNFFTYAILLQVSFKHILMCLNNSVGPPDSARILYNTSLLTDLQAFFNSTYS
jgi:hypothetical protein